jgi:hypothetical protein
MIRPVGWTRENNIEKTKKQKDVLAKDIRKLQGLVADLVLQRRAAVAQLQKHDDVMVIYKDNPVVNLEKVKLNNIKRDRLFRDVTNLTTRLMVGSALLDKAEQEQQTLRVYTSRR